MNKKNEQSATEPEQWLTEELIENASRGMSSSELLSFCAEFERRVRADEREKCEKHDEEDGIVRITRHALADLRKYAHEGIASQNQQLADARADTKRLEWLFHYVSAKEFRRIGVIYGDGSLKREAIDKAMEGSK